MRKIILVAAMLLTSASAQADGSRSLSLPTAAAPAAAPQTTTTSATTTTTQLTESAPATEAPKYSDRPPAVSLSEPAPTTTTSPPIAAPVATTKPATRTTAKTNKPKHTRSWTERRIISELHRHGIYW